MNVHVRAVFVARIFDVLGWVVLVLGALGALAGIVILFTDGLEGLFIFFVAAIYSVLTWAAVALPRWSRVTSQWITSITTQHRSLACKGGEKD